MLELNQLVAELNKLIAQGLGNCKVESISTVFMTKGKNRKRDKVMELECVSSRSKGSVCTFALHLVPAEWVTYC